MKPALRLAFVLALAAACRAPRGQESGAPVILQIEMPPDAETGALSVRPLFQARDLSAALASTAEDLAPHVHEHHAETVYVLAGAGRMWVGDREVDLRPGLLVHVPPGVPHAVEPTSPAHALSIFTPPFDGVDRIPAEIEKP